MADFARIGSDVLRLGSGIGCALFNERASASDKAWAVARDIGRGLTLTGGGGFVVKSIGKSQKLNAWLADKFLAKPGLLRFAPKSGVSGTLNAAGWRSGKIKKPTEARSGWSMIKGAGGVARIQWSAAGGRRTISYWKVSGARYGTTRVPYLRFGKVPKAK